MLNGRWPSLLCNENFLFLLALEKKSTTAIYERKIYNLKKEGIEII